jgi:predicted TIM-barrel fold metal-dependent hydrolase
MTVTQPEVTRSGALDEPLIVVSCDTHIGPRLRDDLRPYCPAARLDDFDAFVAQVDDQRAALFARITGRQQAGQTRNRHTEGHYDMAARRRDLDQEGVAAEIIFHGSQNEEPIPWGTFVVFIAPDTKDMSLVALGRHIFNQWLADACATAPERHIGLCQLPMWDIDAAIEEMTWARSVGLRGVNFPAPGATLPPFNDDVWEPFWSAAEDLDMTLTTHAGAGDPSAWKGPEGMAVMTVESGGWFSRRGMHQMVFGGVFERHPRLKLVLTEQPGDWWSYTMRELDSVYTAHRASVSQRISRKPSEYCLENVFIGGSFLAPFEAQDAVERGYATNVMWGSDYPHMEGTWQNPMPGDEVGSFGRVALRHTFSGVPAPYAQAMAGDNAVRVYGLDADALRVVARRIDAPNARELATPIEAVPAGASPFSFRTWGPWA